MTEGAKIDVILLNEAADFSNVKALPLGISLSSFKMFRAQVPWEMAKFLNSVPGHVKLVG